jgi:hypothetical protein
MKVILEINDSKADAVLQVLRDLPYVKIQPIENGTARKDIEAPSTVEFLNELKEAVAELNLIKAGKKKGKPLTEFLNELPD